MNTNLFFLFLLLLLGAVIGLFLFISKKFQELSQKSNSSDSFQMLNQNIQGMNESLTKTNIAIGQRLDSASQVISQVSKELGQVQEIGHHMQSLQEFFRSPKLRGNIGEQVLRDLLEQYFSKQHFEIQYHFQDGSAVDAILKTSSGMIPIDSKFPMENFQRMAQAETEADKLLYQRQFIADVKKHIQDISKKYILPAEGTVDFAVMYVPNEAVYYEIIRQEVDLNTFAYNKKIFPVSPNSFYYFLKILMIGMQGQRIQDTTKKIIETLKGIQKETEKFGDEMNTINTHLNHATTAMSRLQQRHSKLAIKMDQVHMLDAPQATTPADTDEE